MTGEVLGYEAVLAAVQRPFEELWTPVEERVDQTVLRVVRDVAENHDRLVKEHGLDGSAPEDPHARLRCLAGYRHGVVADILPELERTFTHHHPTFLIADELARTFNAAREACRVLPVTAPVAWGPEAWDARSTDGAVRRLWKGLGRATGAARRAEVERAVPLRAVAERHLERRVRAAIDGAASDVARGWAFWVWEFEEAWTEWAHEALPALSRVVSNGVPEKLEVQSDADPSNEEEDSSWDGVRRAAERLAHRLGDLARAHPHGDVRRGLEARLTRARTELESDLDIAGSLFLRPSHGKIGDVPLRQLARIRKALSAWDAEASSRLALYRAYLAIVVGADAVRRRGLQEMQGMADAAAPGSASSADCLRRVAEGVPQVIRDGESSLGMKDMRAEALRAVEEACRALPTSAELLGPVEGWANEAIESLQGIVHQSSERFLLHRLDANDPRVLRLQEPRTVLFRAAARQSLDALRLERVRTAVLGFATRVREALEGLEALHGVVEYAFDAVEAELDGERAETANRALATDREEVATVLRDALLRSAETVGSVPERLRTAAGDADASLARELEAGAGALWARLEAGRVQGQLLLARSRLVAAYARTAVKVRGAARPWARWSRLVGIRGFRTSRRWFRHLRGLLDGRAKPAARSARAIRTLAFSDSGSSEIPLLYRRLFSPDPLSEAALLVGRHAETAEMLQRWKRWRIEDEVPVVVVGSPGVGVTSFLNVLSAGLRSEGARVVGLDLERRMRSEGEVAHEIATCLELEPTEDLDTLAKLLIRAPADGLPDIVVLDGLENLYLRVPGGTDFLERFLTFASQTEPRIFWIVGVSRPAWQMIQKSEPFAASQVDQVEIAPLPSARLREAMLQRHRRSGLDLRFAEPVEGRALLKRRLRRTRGPVVRQSVLADDFFEQLHRVSVGNLKLALFHWLLASDFEREEGVVWMHPLEKPDFSVLEALELTQNFTLKALLEHRTLTLMEHRAVFRVSPQESYQIFESLQNRRLVETLSERSSGVDGGGQDQTETRYRIRPLLVGAVIAHLRERNIVH